VAEKVAHDTQSAGVAQAKFRGSPSRGFGAGETAGATTMTRRNRSFRRRRLKFCRHSGMIRRMPLAAIAVLHAGTLVLYFASAFCTSST
jgi:hypothetical protein